LIGLKLNLYGIEDLDLLNQVFASLSILEKGGFTIDFKVDSKYDFLKMYTLIL
jgi:hypothetical protein